MKTLFRFGWGGAKLAFWLAVMVVCMSACTYQLVARDVTHMCGWSIAGFSAIIMMLKVIGRTVRAP